MENEIVIKTEVVKVSELNDRERQIYDYAFERGKEAAAPDPRWWQATKIVLFLAWLSAAIYFCR